MAVKRNLMIDQGETVILDFTWRTKVTQTPVNITGATIVLQIRQTADLTSPVLFEASTTNGGIIITDGAAGKFKVTITAAQTVAMEAAGVPADPTANPALYEIKLRFADLRVRSMMAGQVIYKKAVTFL